MKVTRAQLRELRDFANASKVDGHALIQPEFLLDILDEVDALRSIADRSRHLLRSWLLGRTVIESHIAELVAEIDAALKEESE